MDTKPLQPDVGLSAAQVGALEDKLIDEMAVALAAIARSIYQREIETNKNNTINITQCKTQTTTK